MSVSLKRINANEFPSWKTISLYKYMTSEALHSFLLHGDLKITFPEDANDPFEFLDSDHTPPERNSQHGFIALSKDKDNPALWGNYAEEYKGACLEFSIPYVTHSAKYKDNHCYNALAALAKIMSADDREAYTIGARGDISNPNVIDPEDGDILYKCMYKESPFNEKETYSPPPDTPGLFSEEYPTIMKIYDRIATKSLAWKHENEYRIAIDRKNATRIAYNGKKIYLSNRLTPFCKTIILAPFSFFSPEDVQLINPSSPPTVKAEFKKGFYSLDIPIPS